MPNPQKQKKQGSATSVKAKVPKNNVQAIADVPMKATIISGFWKNSKKEIITTAKIGDTVSFEIEIQYATKATLQLYTDDGFFSDTKIGDKVEISINKNIGKHSVKLDENIYGNVKDGLYFNVQAESEVKKMPSDKKDYLKTAVLGGAILVVFPNFPIDPEMEFAGYKVPKLEFLGHAGVLIIKKDKTLVYYEYGRYRTQDKTKGVVRKSGLQSNLFFDKDGIPTEKSLKQLMKILSSKFGKKGKVQGAYIMSSKVDKMIKYAEEKFKESNYGCKGYNPNRLKYDIQKNNCGTFASDVVCKDETVDRPTIINPTPRNIVEEYWEEKNTKIEYCPKTDSLIIKKGDESDAKK